jgi:hypothetical protein
MSIQSLKQESSNKWIAIYNGNYGNYTIKINFNEDNSLKKFHCNCPSDYHPCKHIDMILSAISKMKKNAKPENENHSELIETLFNGKSKNKFQAFLVEYAKYNPEFVNKIKLDFFSEKSVKSAIKINQIISDGLPSGQLEDYYDDYGHSSHYEEEIELEILDQWKEKADVAIANHNYSDALDIAKAMFEEYYIWAINCDSEYLDYVSEHYEDYPFEIFNDIINVKATYTDAVFDFLKEKYTIDNFKNAQNAISNFIGENIRNESDKAFYLKSQNQLQQESKSEYEKERFIANIVDFYLKNNQNKEAWELITENIKYDRFRKTVIEKQISENNLIDAKQLINDGIKNDEGYRLNDWYGYLLQIAKLENNNIDICTYSYWFIKSDFDSKYYSIYKSTFSEKEWQVALKKMEESYNRSGGLSNSLVRLWLEEKQKEKALDYFLFHKNIEFFENYVSHFSQDFPKETLAIYTICLNKYATNNMGRNHYDYVAKILKNIKKIEGGSVVVKEMLEFYRLEYKKRPAMMEILTKNFKL